MDDLNYILDILRVKHDILTTIEQNALLLYVVEKETLESSDMSYHDSIKIDRLIDTIAFIMETKVYQQGADESDYEKDIRAMGWVDDFAQESIDIFNMNGGRGWGHRMVSDWAKDWMSSLLSEYRYTYLILEDEVEDNTY
jgi:hypothetical protein